MRNKRFLVGCRLFEAKCKGHGHMQFICIRSWRDIAIVITVPITEHYKPHCGSHVLGELIVLHLHYLSIFNHVGHCNLIDKVDESILQLLAKQYVKLNLQIGGAWYLYLTTGFACVDIRQFYYHVPVSRTQSEQERDRYTTQRMEQVERSGRTDSSKTPTLG
jgi:hypothetical protein